ncbi:MAG: hypothetical protein L5655_07480 [Thermosediminibacteraceae bacterium]|nr:hypothetical protein [Thermosediminibacteraceae bacterium]
MERTSRRTIELENNIFIEFFADEQYEQEIRDILAKFDPKNYPVNPEAIKLALLKNACANFGQILAFIEHHGFLGLPVLFIEGFNSAVRIPSVPLNSFNL